MLAHARGSEQHRHDGRQTRLDGYGRESNRRLSANAHGRFHQTLPRHRYLYRHLHERWFGPTQGNELLIPTPPLPPCASAICDVAPVPGPKSISDNAPAQKGPATSQVARLRIIHGPVIELSTEHLTVIRWTTENPGGSPVHYGVVHYGTNLRDLSQTAESPIRLNPDHSSTEFRVRMDGLKPATTYYYTVDSIGASGKDDGIKSGVRRFTSP